MDDIEAKTDEFMDWVKTLSYLDRGRVLDRIAQQVCVYCGGEPGCYCWNDE